MIPNCPIYVVDAELRLPSLARLADLGTLDMNSDFLDAPLKGIRCHIQNGNPVLNENSQFYPKRSDLKTLRRESIAAVDCTGELLARNNLSCEERNVLALYASTSLSLGQNAKDLEEVLRVIQETKNQSPAMRNSQLLRDLHPLFGLRALTNAAAAFIAQSLDIHGESATFGDTVTSGYQSLKCLIDDLESERSSLGLLCGTHCSGFFSSLALEAYHAESSIIRECTNAASILFSNTTRGSSHNSWRITEYGENPVANSRWDFAFSAGACNDVEAKTMNLRLAELAPKSYQSYAQWGSCGASALAMGLSLGLKLAEQQAFKNCLCVERDVFGQNFYVALERVNA